MINDFEPPFNLEREREKERRVRESRVRKSKAHTEGGWGVVGEEKERARRQKGNVYLVTWWRTETGQFGVDWAVRAELMINKHGGDATAPSDFVERAPKCFFFLFSFFLFFIFLFFYFQF